MTTVASSPKLHEQFAQAVRLLEHPDNPQAFVNGVTIVETAADHGHAEATAQLATIEAIGAGRPQNWQRALDLLQLAAERGSTHAQGQLRLLNGHDPAGAADDWSDLRGSIDVDRLLAAPERESLSDRPRIRVVRGFASPAECAWMIARVRPKLGPAMVWDELSGMGKLDPSRSNSAVELRVTDMDVVTEAVRARISRSVKLPEPIFETPQVMQYAVGQEFRPHHDFLDPHQPGTAADLARRGQRIATFIIYLNDDFEGGETQFPKAGIAHRGGTGDALFFANITPEGAPDPLTLHAGTPPTKGEKWIFSQWIRDRSPAMPAGPAS
jgi:prolyl 4-hydroxylase